MLQYIKKIISKFSDISRKIKKFIRSFYCRYWKVFRKKSALNGRYMNNRFYFWRNDKRIAKKRTKMLKKMSLFRNLSKICPEKNAKPKICGFYSLFFAKNSFSDWKNAFLFKIFNLAHFLLIDIWKLEKTKFSKLWR